MPPGYFSSQSQNVDVGLQPPRSHPRAGNLDVVAHPSYGIDPRELNISVLGHNDLDDASHDPSSSSFDSNLDLGFDIDYNLDLDSSSEVLDPYVNFIITPQDESPPAGQQQGLAPRIPCSQPGCSKTFSRKDCLTRHEKSRTHCIVWGRYMCPAAGCPMSQGEGFSRYDKIGEHWSKQHGIYERK